jgi:hypothetical protein
VRNDVGGATRTPRNHNNHNNHNKNATIGRDSSMTVELLTM